MIVHRLPLPRFLWPLLSIILIWSALPGLTAQEDGVYEVTAKGGVGNAVKLTILSGQISSETNSNDSWNLFIKYPQVGFLPGNRYCVFLDGVKKSIYSWGSDGTPANDFSLELTTNEAKRAGILFGVPLVARVHPGHRIDAVFTTEKQVYAPGEPIVVTLKIRNVGDTPFYFCKGGHQRGPRDDQFKFFGNGPQGTLPVKEAVNFGGIMQIVTILPSEEVSVGAELNAWFDIERPGRYWLFGGYLLPICKSDRISFPPMWEDYLMRPFSFEVKGKE